MTMLQIEASSVAELLRATRVLSGHTTRTIAPLVGASHGTVSNWERGQGEPSVTQFIDWARATKQPPQALLEGLIELCARRDSNPQPSDSESPYFWTPARIVELESLTRQVDVDSVSHGGAGDL